MARNIVKAKLDVIFKKIFTERSLYYWAQTYGNQLKKGEEYSEIKPTISINIVNYSVFDTEDYYSKYTMADLEHKRILTDKCAMHYFELSKINRKPDKSDRKKLWMQLINSESEDELDMLQQTNVPAIQHGVCIIRELSEDERVREIAHRREVALRDERSALGNARRLGIKQGRAEGKVEGINQLLDSLRALGYDENELAKAVEQMNKYTK